MQCSQRKGLIQLVWFKDCSNSSKGLRQQKLKRGRTYGCGGSEIPEFRTAFCGSEFRGGTVISRTVISRVHMCFGKPASLAIYGDCSLANNGSFNLAYPYGSLCVPQKTIRSIVMPWTVLYFTIHQQIFPLIVAFAVFLHLRLVVWPVLYRQLFLIVTHLLNFLVALRCFL